MSDEQRWFGRGLHDGIPIGLGYFAVSFALGISARQAGLTAFQATLASLLCNASAGEYAGFTVIAANAPYLEMAVITLIVNARYLLMSAALSQKFSNKTAFIHRFGVAYFITDEIFGASVTQPGPIHPFYNYGLAASSLSLWAAGTWCGVVMGNVLPENVVTALSIGIYGMFLAIIIPPAGKSRVLGSLVAISMLLSFLLSRLPFTAGWSEGSRIILLTIVIAGAAAVLFPVDTEGADS